jgi:hypothetical protein
VVLVATVLLAAALENEVVAALESESEGEEEVLSCAKTAPGKHRPKRATTARRMVGKQPDKKNRRRCRRQDIGQVGGRSGQGYVSRGVVQRS